MKASLSPIDFATMRPFNLPSCGPNLMTHKHGAERKQVCECPAAQDKSHDAREADQVSVILFVPLDFPHTFGSQRNLKEPGIARPFRHRLLRQRLIRPGGTSN